MLDTHCSPEGHSDAHGSKARETQCARGGKRRRKKSSTDGEKEVKEKLPRNLRALLPVCRADAITTSIRTLWVWKRTSHHLFNDTCNLLVGVLQMNKEFAEVAGTDFQRRLKSNLTKNIASEFGAQLAPGVTKCSNFVKVGGLCSCILGPAAAPALP